MYTAGQMVDPVVHCSKVWEIDPEESTLSSRWHVKEEEGDEEEEEELKKKTLEFRKLFLVFVWVFS